MEDIRPRTAAGYKPDSLERARALCLELATVIGDFMKEDVTIVGGLVPPLLIPEEDLNPETEPHPGTMDVDVALSLALLNEGKYRELSARLRGAGYEPDEAPSGNLTRQRWLARDPEGSPMTLEFLIAPPTVDAEPGTPQDLEPDFAAVIMDGMQLSFEDRELITLSGRTLRGEEVGRREVGVAGPGAFIVLKAIALRNRGRRKDAFDLHFVLNNYGGGIEDVADRLIPLLADAVAHRAVEFLREDFETLDHLGPRRAAAFLGREEDEGLRADVSGLVMELVARCDEAR